MRKERGGGGGRVGKVGRWEGGGRKGKVGRREGGRRPEMST